MRSTLGLLSRGATSCLGTTTELLLSRYHSLDAVVHVLDKFDFREAESSLVGDVVNVIGRFRVLTVDTSNLNLETVSDGLEFILSGTEIRQGDVN